MDGAELEATSRRLLDHADEYTWAAHVERVEGLFDEVLAETGYVRSPER